MAIRHQVGLTLTAVGLALTAGALWGSLGFITQILLSYGLSPTQLGLLRLGGAFFLTLFIATILGRLRALSWRQWGVLAAIGLICQALSSVSFSVSVAGVGSSLAIALLCMGPLFTVLLNWVCFHELPGIKAILLVILALAGLVLTVICGNDPHGSPRLFGAQWYAGIAWGVVSGFCYGLFPIFVRLLGRLDVWIIVSVSLGAGMVFLVPLQIQVSIPAGLLQINSSVWLWIAALILIPTVFADVLYVRAIAAGGPMLASVFALFEVPASAIYAWWWLAELLTFLQWAGMALFCTCLVGLALHHGQNGASDNSSYSSRS